MSNSTLRSTNPFAAAEPALRTTASGDGPRLMADPVDTTEQRRYRQMLMIRTFEETLLELFDLGVLNGTTHCCIGQEADAVGVIEHLGEHDHVFSNHRCHGHYLARTGDAEGLLAEIMGRTEGVCGGIGGSQHLSAPGFTSNGVLGGTVANAAGIAMASQLDGNDAISVVFLGDGALGEGIVYETLNLAALWQLPLLLVCEDNGWAQSTPRSANLAGSISARFDAFGIPVTSLDSTDVAEIGEVAGHEVAATRGAGPRALVLGTYRLCHHSKNDDNRPADEVAARWELDPLRVAWDSVSDSDRSRIEQQVTAAIGELVERFTGAHS